MFNLVVLLLLGNSSYAEQLVRVKSHVVVVPNSNVTLGQLLDLNSVSEAFKNETSATTVTIAPNLGERIEVTNVAVTSFLREAIAKERNRSRVAIRLIVPSKVIIDTVKRTIDSAVVQAELIEAWRPLCPGCDLEIRNLSLPIVENIVDWTLKLKAEMPRGSFAIPIEIKREGAGLLQAWINGQIIVKKKMPVAKRLLSSGERIVAQDVGLERVDVTFSLDSAPTVEELLGKKLRQNVRANDPIWRNYIDREKALHRGEAVRVTTSQGLWEVSANMVADQDAFVGETVSIKNPRTNKILTGTAVARGEVELR